MPQQMPDLRQYVLDKFPPAVRIIVSIKHPQILKPQDLAGILDSHGKPLVVPGNFDANSSFTQIAELLGTSETVVVQAYQNFLRNAQTEIYRAGSPPAQQAGAQLQRIPLIRSAHSVAESQRNFAARERDGFWERFVRPGPFVDVGYSGGHAHAEPLFTKAIGLDLDTPGYNGKDLPYHDCSIGTIHGSHLLEHIADYQYFFREAVRALVHGGTLIIVVPLMEAYENRLVGPSIHNPDHKRFYTASRLCQELECSLPRTAYRLIHLRENFSMDDINRQQGVHAGGPAYEIECVIEKTTPGAKYVA